MRRYANDEILTSPSDPITFGGCGHARFLDVEALSGDMGQVCPCPGYNIAIETHSRIRE